MAMRYRAVLSCRLPERLNRTRPVVLPDSFELKIRVKADDQGAMLGCNKLEPRITG